MTDPYSEVFCGRQPPEERSISWKGARKILGCSDSAIHEISRRPAGKVYYTVLGVMVIFVPYNKKQQYRCLKPQCGVRGDCPHIRRLERYLRERREA